MKSKLLILLFFMTSSYLMSQVGINTENPLSELHIIPTSGQDPLILSGLKSVSDSPNEIDGSNVVYSNLKISANGVVRREKAASANQSAVVNLAADLNIPNGTSNGSGGSIMDWFLTDGTRSSYITLPETGAYVFSFRLFGTVGTLNAGATHYISSWKGEITGSSAPFDIAEIYVTSVGATVANTVATYSINLTVSGNAGDHIYFKISRYNNAINWTLNAADLGSDIGSKTSMLYWKL